MRASQPLCRNSSLGAAKLTSGPLTLRYRTVATKDQILVPETLLKKRKSQEKERAEKVAAREQKKKVRAYLGRPSMQ